MADETEDKGLKDLTGRPNKKLTPAQRQAKKQSNAGNYTDINYDGVPDRDQVDFSRLSADLQWVGKIIDADPTLKGIFEHHSKIGSFDPESGQTGINNFQNDIMDSEWWKTNNQYARSAFALKTTDPSAYESAVEDAEKNLTLQAQAKGAPIPPDRLRDLAEKSISDGWNVAGREYRLDEALNEFIPADGVKTSGDLRAYANTLRNTATANGLKFTDQYYQDQARSISLGLLTEKDAMANLREQAAGLWPSYSDKIIAGYNVRDLASGYIYTMADELEIDAQSISLNDNYIRQALTSVNEKGDSQPQSLWQFQRSLREDPRWMDTTKAQNEIGSTANKVMQMFGLVG